VVGIFGVFVIAGCVILCLKKPKQKIDKNIGQVPKEKPSDRPLNPKKDEIPERPDPATVRVDPEITVRPDPRCDDSCDQYTPDS
jgi:hypothetical protein